MLLGSQIWEGQSFDRFAFVQVFEKARAYKARNKSENVLPVVLLDEVGLAEVSRHNPLKVLLLCPFSRMSRKNETRVREGMTGTFNQRARPLRQ